MIATNFFSDSHMEFQILAHNYKENCGSQLNLMFNVKYRID